MPASSLLRQRFTAILGGTVLLLLSVGIYQLTRNAIANSQARQLREAVFKVLPGASRFQKLVYAEGTLKPVALQARDGEFVYAGYDMKGAFVGYAIAGEGPGYQGTIRLLYGYKPSERRIVGVEIVESQETVGSGDKIQTDAEFREDLRTLSVEPRIVIVKKGEKSKPNQVEAITGATVSSNGVVAILDRSSRRWFTRFPPPGTEPPLLSNSPQR